MWVWLTKVGVAFKFSRALRAQIIKHPPLLNPGYATAISRGFYVGLATKDQDVIHEEDATQDLSLVDDSIITH